MSLKLEKPSIAFGKSYRTYLAELRQLRENPVPFVLRMPAADFPALVKRLEDCAKGIGISDWFVAHETFWLVSDDCEIVGISNLRLRLNDALQKDGGHIGLGIRPSARRQGYATVLLAETLKKAAERGIEKVLLTCDRTNTGSAKAILANGGVFESEDQIDGRTDVIQRYWIET